MTGALDEPGYVTVGVDGAGEASPAGPVPEPFAGAGGATLRPAAGLWGLDVPATLERLRELHPQVRGRRHRPGRRARRAVREHRQQPRPVHRARRPRRRDGRPRRLKALVVDGHGDHKPPVADPERLEFIVYEAEKLLKSNPITSHGAARVRHVGAGQRARTRPAPCPRATTARASSRAPPAICGEMLKKDHVQRRSACRGCIIGCARRTTAGGQSGEGPEYETIWALGAECGVSDLTAIVQANYACNRAGMDTITMGVDHRLRHGAHRAGPAARRPALRRRARPSSSWPRPRPRARASAPSSGSARRASRPCTAAPSSP